MAAARQYFNALAHPQHRVTLKPGIVAEAGVYLRAAIGKCGEYGALLAAEK